MKHDRHGGASSAGMQLLKIGHRGRNSESGLAAIDHRRLRNGVPRYTVFGQ